MIYLPLKSKLETAEILAIADDEARLAALTAKDILVKKPIQVRDIEEYLMITDNYEAVEASTSVAAKRAMKALALFKPTIDITHTTLGAAREAKLISILDGLVADPESNISATDKTAILDLGYEYKSWAELNGYNPLRIGYFAKARSL